MPGIKVHAWRGPHNHADVVWSNIGAKISDRTQKIQARLPGQAVLRPYASLQLQKTALARFVLLSRA